MDGHPALTPREEYILETAPILLSAMTRRRILLSVTVRRPPTVDASTVADEAIETAGEIWDLLETEQHPWKEKLLGVLPRAVADYMVSCPDRTPSDLLRLAFRQTQIIHEILGPKA